MLKEMDISAGALSRDSYVFIDGKAYQPSEAWSGVDVWQGDGQFFLCHGVYRSIGCVHHGEGFPPVSLTTVQPVTQLVVHLAFTGALLF